MDYNKEYQRLLKRYERMYTPVIFRAIKKQIDQYFKNGNLNDIKDDPVINALEQLYKKVGVQWAGKTDRQIRIDLKLPRQSFSARFSRLLIRQFGPEILNKSNDITNTTKDRIRSILVRSVKENLTLDEVAREISNDQINRNRARTIARTETIRAANASALLNVEDKGYLVRKQWLSVIDKRTRDDHRELDMKIVDKNGSWRFTDKNGVTQTLKFPGDPDAPPEQTINCRCTMVFLK